MNAYASAISISELRRTFPHVDPDAGRSQGCEAKESAVRSGTLSEMQPSGGPRRLGLKAGLSSRRSERSRSSFPTAIPRSRFGNNSTSTSWTSIRRGRRVLA